MNELKVFTLEEANRLLPTVTERTQDLHRKRDEITAQEVEVDALELVRSHTDDDAAGALEKLMARHRELVAEFYEVVDQIHSYGCFLNDADLGLVDFYGTVDGHTVYLCWRLGEQQVGFWHEVGQGYANRNPIDR